MGGSIDTDFKKLKPDTGYPPLNLTLSDELILIIECVLMKLVKKTEERNLILELLHEYIPANKNGGWIPFDIDERKKLYPKAFSELGRYMQDSHKHHKHHTYEILQPRNLNYDSDKPLTKLLLKMHYTNPHIKER
jgi:hypothetical protein